MWIRLLVCLHLAGVLSRLSTLWGTAESSLRSENACLERGSSGLAVNSFPSRRVLQIHVRGLVTAPSFSLLITLIKVYGEAWNTLAEDTSKNFQAPLYHLIITSISGKAALLKVTNMKAKVFKNKSSTPIFQYYHFTAGSGHKNIVHIS